MLNQSSLVCPQCGQIDAVRKVTSIASEGIQVGEYQATTKLEWGGKTYYLPTTQGTASKTLLSQRLLPPLKPSMPDYIKQLTWENAIQRWTEAFYCSRCDGVFIPGEGPIAPLEEMPSFLERYLDAEEVCQIEARRTDAAWWTSKSGYWFYASALGRQGKYTAGESFWPDKMGLVTENQKSRDAINQLMQQLQREGWQLVGCGDRWYQSRFKRKSSK